MKEIEVVQRDFLEYTLNCIYSGISGGGQQLIKTALIVTPEIEKYMIEKVIGTLI